MYPALVPVFRPSRRDYLARGSWSSLAFWTGAGRPVPLARTFRMEVEQEGQTVEVLVNMGQRA